MRQFNSSVMKLKGFDEFYEALEKANVNAKVEGQKVLEQCTKNMVDELKGNATAAGVSSRLVNQVKSDTVNDFDYGLFSVEVGWKKPKWNGHGEIPDAYKVLFMNYGTPRRRAKADGQRVQINGQWVTLGTDRGNIKPKNFIANAKRAAAVKNKKLMRDALKKMTKGLSTE